MIVLLTTFWTSWALAAGIHAGLPVDTPGLGQPTFLAPESGWTTDIPGGFIRVFVGKDEAQTLDWIARERVALVVTPAPLTGLADEAWGDGELLVLLRDGNVGMLIRVESGAKKVAKELLGRVVDGVPWPATPRLRTGTNGTIEVEPAGVVHVQVEGASLVGLTGYQLDRAPRVLVTWDRYGRASIASDR